MQDTSVPLSVSEDFTLSSFHYGFQSTHLSHTLNWDLTVPKAMHPLPQASRTHFRPLICDYPVKY